MSNEDQTNNTSTPEKPVNGPRIDENDLTLIKVFAAQTNNHLMSQSVVGDDILKSARLMDMAHKIVKLIEGLK